MTSAYPLQWPQGFPRAKARETGKFKTSLSAALQNVERSLVAFGRDSGKPVRDIVLSSNYSLGVSRPGDPGVAVWFMWEGEQRCIPIDRYSTVEANLQAIHHVLEARRTEIRHGTLALVKATFQGFIALPAPEGKHWKDILELSNLSNISKDVIEQAYKKLALVNHPDKGGDAQKMAKLNNARQTALREVAA